MKKYKTFHENHNQISTCEESNNNLPFVEIDNSCSQQVQIENFQVNNYKFDFVEQMNDMYNDYMDLVFETYLKQRE